MRGSHERWWALLGAVVLVGSTVIDAHATTMSEAVTSCTPCHGLIVNQVVLSNELGTLGVVVEVGRRSQPRWVNTINDMIDRGAVVDDVNGLAAYLAGLGLETPTPTASPTPSPTPVACIGPCTGSSASSFDQLLVMVDIALGSSPVSSCNSGDSNGSGDITIDELVTAVNSVDACPA